MKTYVVIAAAGSGLRFDDSLPKQYSIICDKSLIYYTINAFLRIQWLDQIIVVSDSKNVKLMQEIIASISHQNRIHCVIGSTSRHRSIAKGIESIVSNQWPLPDVVVIHDGARPLVEEQLLIQLVSSALKYGASGIICKLTSTVLSVSNDHFLDKALDRSQHYASETPQAFRYDNIRSAYNQCSENDFEFNTECLDLVQRYTSAKVKLIEANADQYFKVTFKKDLYSVEGILRDKRHLLLHCDFDSETHVNYQLIHDLKDSLEKTFTNVTFFSNSSAVKITSNPLMVRILIKFCNSWKDMSEEYIPKCDSLIYVVITGDQINNICYEELNRWLKSRTDDIQRVYAIHSNLNEINKNKDRIIKTIMFLSKQCPTEMSGQIFFV